MHMHMAAFKKLPKMYKESNKNTNIFELKAKWKKKNYTLLPTWQTIPEKPYSSYKFQANKNITSFNKKKVSFKSNFYINKYFLIEIPTAMLNITAQLFL